MRRGSQKTRLSCWARKSRRRKKRVKWKRARTSRRKKIIKEVPKSEESSEYDWHYRLGEKRKSSGKAREKKTRDNKENLKKKILTCIRRSRCIKT